jgi:DNA-binding transcriptional LysR family regulator
MWHSAVSVLLQVIVMRWNDRIGRRLKLSELHALLAVAECGSMSRAADLLSTSHPVISRSIRDLEQTLGARLVDRSARGVQLTAYGRAMTRRTLAAFDELRNGVRDIESLADPGAGDVRVGTTSALARSYVTAVIERLSRRHPRLGFHVAAGDSRTLYRTLRDRDFDLLIARRFDLAAEDDLAFEALYDDPYVVAAGSHNELARRRRLGLAELVDRRWVLPPADTLVGALVKDAFRAHGLEQPRTVVETLLVEVRNSLLETSDFLTVLPKSILVWPRKHRFIRELPVVLPNAGGAIGIFTVRSRVLTPAAELFIRAARDLAGAVSRATG